MNGLLGALQGQTQGQQQGNLLGGVFQNPSNLRRQERNRLLGNAIELSQLRDPFSASIAMGATQAGLGIGRALGFETEADRKSRILGQIQQEVVDRGFDPMTDPEGTFNYISERARELGDPQVAALAQRQKFDYIRQLREMMPEPVERNAATFYNPQTGEFVRGYTAEGVAFDESGNRLPSGFVEREFERPTQNASFVTLSAEEKQSIGIDTNKFAQRNTVTGRVHTSGGQTINVGGQPDPAFEALTKQVENDLTSASEAATQATGLLQEVNRATQILSNPEFNSGAARPILTNLRALAEDLNVSIDPALEAAGVEDLGQVSGAESFRAFSANLTTRLAERLPGNLNQQEINLISTASSDLGKTPEANAEALASFRAGAELAQQRANALSRAALEGTEAFLDEQRRQREAGIERFERLAERYKQEILQSRGTSQTPVQTEPAPQPSEFEGFQIRALD